ncbi:MAG: PASTA domain-containing protein [Coriobacteriia bacterium]|nr:PASTA domain-containing protein [Coriobacteriia bacterium]
MAQRPRRKRLLPIWLLSSVAATVLVVMAGGFLADANYRASLVSVPSIVGRPADVAEQSARLSGLAFQVSGRRFSAEVPEGSVLYQEPVAGERVSRGAAVQVVLSAGSEKLIMPDVVGMSLQEARDALREHGLGVVTDNIVSRAVAGTVLGSFPASGAEVSTGATVRLSIAIGGASADSLLPYDLHDLVIALDPAPAREGSIDIALDVARRVRSLLEASGARVTVTRSLTQALPSDAARSSTVASPTPDAMVGLSLSGLGGVGMTAVVVRSTDATAASDAESVAKTFTASVRLPGQTVNPYRTDDDAVLGKVLAPGVRVLLGDANDAADAARFGDPNWADLVARALYRALGETFATR